MHRDGMYFDGMSYCTDLTPDILTQVKPHASQTWMQKPKRAKWVGVGPPSRLLRAAAPRQDRTWLGKRNRTFRHEGNVLLPNF